MITSVKNYTKKNKKTDSQNPRTNGKTHKKRKRKKIYMYNR